MRILVISAGLGSPSATQLLGDRLAKSARRVLEESVDRVEIEHIELREIASDLANLMVTRVPSPRLVEVMDAVTHATGVVAVTPVMNSSYSGLFKMFFDALDQGAMKGRPVLMAATGGTARHSLMIENAMLPMFYLKAVPSPMGVFAATEDWGRPTPGCRSGSRTPRPRSRSCCWSTRRPSTSTSSRRWSTSRLCCGARAETGPFEWTRLVSNPRQRVTPALALMTSLVATTASITASADDATSATLRTAAPARSCAAAGRR